VLQGLTVALAGAGTLAATDGVNWPDGAICGHGAGATDPASQLPTKRVDWNAHCIYCLGGVAHVLLAPAWGAPCPRQSLISAPLAFADFDLPRRSTGDPSGHPRGPPLAV